MCGINGALRLSPTAPAVDREEILRTRQHQARRGPDGSGLWESGDGRIALAHNRLAILDLSPAGAQPMSYGGGRYHITYNGELYNFRSLRAELEAQGTRFVTASDTEVLVALYALEGVAMLRRLRGMYAFAIWDDVAKVLLLARDPFGIKPLYYAAEGGLLRFGSQVRALMAGGGISSQVDVGAVAGFLIWGSVPEPMTLRQAVRQLPAGHYLLVENGRLGEPTRHYDPSPEAGEAANSPPMPLEEALSDSVRAHLVSDVPVAVFLSAGLDSSMLAALASRHHSDLCTITVRFPALRNTPADEGPLAARVAAALGSRHRELEVPAGQLRTLWPASLAAMDQPSIDGFNTFVISRAAHEAGFKVVLSGLGGDELLGGYSSFRSVPRLRRAARAARLVPGLARLWPRVAAATGRPKADGLLRLGGTLPGAYLLRRGLFLPDELPGLLGADTAAEALRRYDPLADAAAALEEPSPMGRVATAEDPWLAVHQLETTRYMRHQLLRDSDWAAMAWSVELRVPFVDPKLRGHLARSGFAPVRRGGKAAAMKALMPELAAVVAGRRKTGFFVPVVEALTSSLTPGSKGAQSRILAILALREHGVEVRSDRLAKLGDLVTAV